jgi:hypothetical protein
MVRVCVEIDQWHGPIERNGEVILPCRKGDVIIVENKTWESMQRSIPGGFSFVEHFDPQSLKHMTEVTTPEERLDFKTKVVRRKTNG